jgi:hypothetical protein
MNPSRKTSFATALVLAGAVGATSACGAGTQTEPAGASVSPRRMADALHAVMEADRTVYTRHVVNRLQTEEKVIAASEHWKDEKALPLPAQMFRMGSELAAQKNSDFTYALLSLWPVNKQNGPKTDGEKAGLQYIIDHKGENYYSEEQLGGQTYFTAVYPDVAVAQACISCHNGHQDSPRSDFEMGDVMGGVVVRIPLAQTAGSEP